MIAAKNLQINLSKGDNYEKKNPIEICGLPLGYPPLSVLLFVMAATFA